MQNAAERKQIRQAEKRALQNEVLRAEFVKQMMGTINGRLYAHNWLSRCHVFSISITPDPYQTYFNEGERNQGLQLLNDINTYCPDQYVTMMREANEREYANDRNSDNSDDGSPTSELDGSEDSGRDAAGSGSPTIIDYDPFNGTDENTR